jgi:hypothetical protein
VVRVGFGFGESGRLEVMLFGILTQPWRAHCCKHRMLLLLPHQPGVLSAVSTNQTSVHYTAADITTRY